MQVLRDYQDPSFDDYVATLAPDIQAKLAPCIGRCIGARCGNFCSSHIKKWDEIKHKALIEFCAANQPIVPELMRQLETANSETYPEFFRQASRFPLVAYNDGDGPAWCFNGRTLEYHPGRTTLDAFSSNMKKLEAIENEAWQLMDDCCKNRKCEDHWTEARLRTDEATRMRSAYKTPFKRFSVRTCKEI